jgi:ribosomal protein L4
MESPARKERRNAITRARRRLIREGKLHVGDGKSLDHIVPAAAGGKHVASNYRIVSARANYRRQPKRKGPNKGKIAQENKINGV